MTTLTDEHDAMIGGWRALLYTVLTASSAVNGLHGFLTYYPDLLRASIAGLFGALPPLAFFWVIELALKTFRRGVQWLVYAPLLMVVAVVSSAAFVLSFYAILDFARTWAANPAPWTAWLFPVLFDVLMAGATYVVVVLSAHPAKRVPRVKAAKPRRRRRGLVWVARDFLIADPEADAAETTPRPPAPPTRLATREPANRNSRNTVTRQYAEPAPANRAVNRDREDGTATAPATPQPGSAGSAPRPAPVPAPATPEIRELASRVHAARVARKLDADGIADILAADAAGVAPNRIASDCGVHRDVVAKVVAAARELAESTEEPSTPATDRELVAIAR